MGSAHCVALANLGAHIIVLDKRPDYANKVAQDIIATGESAEVLESDITDLQETLKKLQNVLTKRSIDILVNHAGISGMSLPFEEIDEAFFDEMMDLGVEGMMISPGYSYDKAPDQHSFLKRHRTRELFTKLLTNRKRRWQFNQSPLFLEFLMGKR